MHLHYCRADHAAVTEDAGAIADAGLRVELAPLESLAPTFAEKPTMVLYWSSACVRDEASFLDRIDRAHARRLPVVLVALDTTSVPPQRAGTPLYRDGASQEYLNHLLAAVLESLDRTGWGNGGDPLARTRIVPSALVVTHAGRDSVIPPDFRGLVTVGRSESCQISIDSTFASRLHGCFRSGGDHYLYRDMSTNGTVIFDGHDELLLHGDEHRLPAVGELRIGDVALTFATERP